jgi:DNA-binding NtrC family response regulator
LKTLKEIEKETIQYRLMWARGNRHQTAKSLGICRNTLVNKMERYGIPHHYGRDSHSFRVNGARLTFPRRD